VVLVRNDDIRQETAHFEISAALFEELGERLVSKPEIALAELIKNSYDADALTCYLTLGDDSVIVKDDGHGMTEDQFLKNWMVVSSQIKGELRYSRKYRRSMAGSKGVGRFSARFLGHVVKLNSVAFDEAAQSLTELVATFNWDQISRSDVVAKAEIPYTIRKVSDKTAPGTTLTITKLRPEAEQISVSKVKTDILRLTNPITGLEPAPFVTKRAAGAKRDADPGFSVVFVGESSDNDDELADDLQTKLLGSYVGRVRLEVTEAGVLSYEVFWRGASKPIHTGEFTLKKLSGPFLAEKIRAAKGELQDSRGLKKSVEAIQQLPLSTALHSPVFVDLRFFPKRKGTFSGLDVNGTRAQRWIREHASFAIVDNQFAMNGYSGASDWLGIDASKATNKRDWQSVFMPALFPMTAAQKADPQLNPMLALPRGTQLIGRVHIATSKRATSLADDSDDWLQPNMDRESLRSNGAFRLLWHVCRFSAELIAHFDREHRLAEQVEREAGDRHEAKSALSRTRSPMCGRRPISSRSTGIESSSS